MEVIQSAFTATFWLYRKSYYSLHVAIPLVYPEKLSGFSVPTMEQAVSVPPAPPDPGGGNNIKESFPILPKPSHLYDPSNQLNGLSNTHFIRYLQIEFETVERKNVNPYLIQNEIKKLTGIKPDELTGSGKSRLTLKTLNERQTNACLKLTELGGKKCKIVPHPKFNSCNGLIFTRDYNYRTEDLEKELKHQYGVKEVQKASFIKTREGVTPFILSFDREETPYVISIPGERADCVVSPFRSKPMMCKKCLVYGHTQKRCQRESPRCKKCSEEGHEIKDCDSQVEKCFHCQQNHLAGSKNCPTQVKEEKILQYVETNKVTFQRARQLYENKPIHRTVSSKTPIVQRKFDIEWPKGTKRNTNPWETKRAIKEKIGKEPCSIRSKANKEDTITVEVSTHGEAVKLSELTRIGEHNVTVTASDIQNLPKGIVFIEGFDMMDPENYLKELTKQYSLVKAEEATWIKSRNPALLLTFSRELPEYLNIPGESKLTAVIENKRKPNLCGKCLNYGHPKRVCREKERCQNCTSTDHSTSQCRQNPKCLHCSLDHKTGSKNCQTHKIEEEIVAIQEKSAVNRSQAIIIYKQEHPQNSTMNYAATAAAPRDTNTTTRAQITDAGPSGSQIRPIKKPSVPAKTEKSQQKQPSAEKPTQSGTIEKNPKLRNKFSALTDIENYDSSDEDKGEPIGPQILDELEKTSRNNPEVCAEVRKIFNEYKLPANSENTDRPSRSTEKADYAKRRKHSQSTERDSKRAKSLIKTPSNERDQNSRSRSPLKTPKKNKDRKEKVPEKEKDKEKKPHRRK